MVAEWVRAKVSQLRGPEFESHRHRFLGKFVYPTLPKSLGTLLVYPERMAVGVKGGKEVCLDYHRHRLGNTSFKVPRECR